ncbi:PTS fructose transporter subunit IIB [Haloterrigena salifodinae]|uniref:PTS sugar transporter subunit IIC n=1 Tax=Haloterrigena salifodinae TaxID=2675099 RepID=A0A8T8DX81_9EURY|nr:PTS fructose transporter subunit IIB [Haloterrigena salifodinae]QRV14184.1 PTS sugar transporter subunit IIC [Haloterrigena salifodinae]
MKFVAVTSCPTGIAHSQMAAENLEQTATDLGHEIDVEVQGAMGQENELSSDAIAEADAVIIAADTSVNRDRFEGKPVVKAPVKDAVNDVEELFERAIAAADGEASSAESAQPAGAADSGTETAGSGAPSRGGDPSKGLFARLKRLLS